MDTSTKAIDLTMSAEQIETNNEVPPPKKPKTELPIASPSGSDNNAPVLEPVVPVPNFSLADIAEEYLATCDNSDPPVLQREVAMQSSSVAKDCQSSTSAKTGPQTGRPTTKTTKERPISMGTPIRFKTSHRVAKESSNTFQNVSNVKVTLERTIDVLKKIEKNSKNSEEMEIVEPRTKNVRISGQNPQPKGKRRRTSCVITPKPHTKNVRISGQNPQPKGKRRRTSCVITPKHANELEARYAANPNPAPSDEHAIAHELDITTSDVKKWFMARRRRVVTHGSPDSGFSDEPGTSSNAMKSQRVKQRTAGNSRVDGRSVPGPDADNHDKRRHDDIAPKTPDDKPGNIRLKFLRDRELRTSDLDIIKQDIGNVKKCALNQFRKFLDKNWELKANRLLEIVCAEGLEVKKSIYKESKRLNRLAAFVNVVSDEQEREVLDWKERFIAKKVEEGKYGEKITIKNIVEEFIVPWIAPFMYSRTTQQDGRNLTLEVALYDFCKITDADVTSNPIDWKTPVLLQTDYPISPVNYRND